MISTQPPTPARRIVLGGLAVSALAGLSACSVRLERDAPQVPGIKTQAPPPDQAALLRALSSTRELTAAATGATGPWAAKLAAMHRAQTARLVDVISTDGISAPPPPAAPSRQATASSRTPAALAAREAAHLSPLAWSAAVTAEPANAAMLAALLAAGAGAATILGAPPAWSQPAPTVAVCVQLLPSVRAAVYALQVIAARTPVAQRSLVTASLLTMSAGRSRLEQAAAGAALPPSQSYRLLIRPDTQASRSQLGQQVLTDVVTAAARAIPRTHGSVPDGKALTREWSNALSLSWSWGVVPTPFPGLVG